MVRARCKTRRRTQEVIDVKKMEFLFIQIRSKGGKTMTIINIKLNVSIMKINGQSKIEVDFSYKRTALTSPW